MLPFIFDFPDGAASTLPVILGAGTVLYSLFTDYELGVSRVISMKTHLGIDYLAGALLAISPWMFGFADEAFWPFLILGIVELGAALMTESHPQHAHVAHAHRH